MPDHDNVAAQDKLLLAMQAEGQKFQEFYLWLEKAMPPVFFDEISHENIILITRGLMGMSIQEYFSTIHLKKAAIVMCLDSPDADLRILHDYALYGIKTYQTYVSKIPPPFPGIQQPLRIAQIFFTEPLEFAKVEEPFPEESKERLYALVKQRNEDLTEEAFNQLLSKIDNRFLRALPIDRLVLVLDMIFRAKARDNCQYELRYNEDWEEAGTASMQVVLAWRNTPKQNFLYRIARIIHRHGLIMKRVNAAYVDPYSRQNILIMTLDLHGSNGQAVWEVADINNFLSELLTVKYFASFDVIDQRLITPGILNGKMGNFLRAAISFIHQCLVHIDPNIYTLEKIEEDLCRHPELTLRVCQALKFKFDPDAHDINKYNEVRTKLLADIDNLDTGHVENDNRRKNVLKQALNLVHYSYKTNFYRLNYTAISFRLDPKYLDDIPFDREKRFPEMPYAIIYCKGMHFFGFHVRFKDLARGGLRTVYPELPEHILSERNSVFTECYNLALTQHKKNKDIPEAGAKGVIFLMPWDRMASESLILRKELEEVKAITKEEINRRLKTFQQDQRIEMLHQSQRSYIESMLTILNCEPDGAIRAKHIVDYWKRPEYIYLGPDENMHDVMIEWIAEFSKYYGYKPGGAFISGKPGTGINHKEFGVTSLGINVYMETLLKHLGIDPTKQEFTVKMSGGPDGDVAGNQMCNLQKFYPQTAKLLAITDVSGTIYDPKGINLTALTKLFKEVKPIRALPLEKMHDGAFLLDKDVKRSPTPLVQQTLCLRKKDGKIVEDWLPGSEMNHLLRNNVHHTKVDIFIPGGGRPRTLNHYNVSDYLDETGKPTSKGIVEGANLYLTNDARRFLEERGCLIIMDSSANKTGVICSSFEVLCGLVLTDEEFLLHKKELVQEILERLKMCAANEANLLIRTLTEEGGYLTDISNRISNRINEFTYELLDYLDGYPLPEDENHPLIQTFLNYCLPTLRNKFKERLLREIPDHHKKAIISCHIAAQLVYKKGLDWHPTIVDILPILLKKHEI